MVLDNNNLYKYFLIIVFLALIYFSFTIIMPFIEAIIWGAVIAYIFFPAYKIVRTKIKNKTVSSAITAIAILLIISIPIIFLLQNIGKEANYLYIKSKQTLSTKELFELDITCNKDESSYCAFIKKVDEWLKTPTVRDQITIAIRNLTITIQSKVTDFILAIPSVFLRVVITLLTTFYLFRGGENLVERLRNSIPLKQRHQDEIIQQLNDVLFAILYGSITVAFIQGVLAILGFYFFDVRNPIMWGIALMFSAMIPFIGSWIIWLPLSVLKIIIALGEADNTEMWKGIGLFIYGLLFISTIDNFLKPYFISERAKISTMIIFLGVFGGLIAFGVIGIILGPLILALLKTFFEIYETEKKEH